MQLLWLCHGIYATHGRPLHNRFDVAGQNAVFAPGDGERGDGERVIVEVGYHLKRPPPIPPHAETQMDNVTTKTVLDASVVHDPRFFLDAITSRLPYQMTVISGFDSRPSCYMLDNRRIVALYTRVRTVL